jgi:hypothetical protein
VAIDEMLKAQQTRFEKREGRESGFVQSVVHYNRMEPTGEGPGAQVALRSLFPIPNPGCFSRASQSAKRFPTHCQVDRRTS